MCKYETKWFYYFYHLCLMTYHGLLISNIIFNVFIENFDVKVLKIILLFRINLRHSVTIFTYSQILTFNNLYVFAHSLIKDLGVIFQEKWELRIIIKNCHLFWIVVNDKRKENWNILRFKVYKVINSSLILKYITYHLFPFV
jgi:hypothetical protein